LTEETFSAVIEAIEAGDTLKLAIAKARTSWAALSHHLGASDANASRYARARTVSADSYADRAQESVEGARTGEEGTIAKIRSDVYRWRASVANPRQYGSKVDVTSDNEKLAGVVILPAKVDR
jgi:hypothetical protein